MISFLFVFLAAQCSLGAVFIAEDNAASVSKDIDDDLYVAGGNVTIESRVDGNLFTGGGNVSINGTFANAFIGAGQVDIKGKADNSVNIGCGSLTADIETGRDLVVGCGNMVVSSDSRIGQDLIFGSGTAKISGQIGRNIKGAGASISIDGQVGGDVQVDADELSIGPDAVIEGDLTYFSDNKARISKGAEITGKIVQKPARAGYDRPAMSTGAKVWAGVVGRIIGLLMAFVTGLVLYLLWPRRMTESAQLIVDEPWKTGGIGLLVILVGPWAIILALISVFGVPTALMAMGLYGFTFYLAKIFVAFFIGKAVVDSWQYGANPLLHLLVGLLLIALMTAIPIFNIFVIIVYLIFGFGAMAMAIYSSVRENRVPKPAQITVAPGE